MMDDDRRIEIDLLKKRVDVLEELVINLAVCKRPNAMMSMVTDVKHTRFPVTLLKKLRHRRAKEKKHG